MGGSSKDPAVGGLVGINFGSIVNSSATCSVSIDSNNGYLAAWWAPERHRLH